MTKRVRFTPFVRAGVFLAGTLLAAAPGRAAVVPFVTPPPVTTTANGAYSAALADVDGDGDQDALSASIYDDKVAWYENVAGNGTAWVLRTITTSADAAFSVHGADVDGDGDTDVLSASVYDDKIAWYENLAGNGSVWAVHTISLTANGARSVRTADVDGDGDTDALSASTDDDKIAWYENVLGNGTVWALRTISTSADSAWSVAAADVDRDGDQDVLSSSAYDDKIAWYENTAGNGTSWTLRTISTAADGALGLFASDVDRDGDVDAMSASISDGELTWYENTAGNGTVWAAHPIATNATGAFSISAGDVDGDGDTDALATVVFDDAVLWFENVSGNGTSWIPRTITTAVNAPVSVVAGDVDGDGDQDVVSAVLYHNAVAWYRNDTIHGDACFGAPPPIGTLFAAWSVVSSDIDKDGDLDALTASSQANSLTWFENAGNGSAWVTRTITTSAPAAFSAFAADLDGDGDQDALTVLLIADAVLWYENTAGNGAAWTVHTVATGADGPREAVAADVDRDGDLDVVAALDGASTVAWYENTAGNGSAWTSHTITTGATFVYSIDVADVDGDGDVDALSASNPTQTVAWYENVGNGASWTARTITTNALGVDLVSSADVDGDGDMDVLRGSTFNITAWHENAAGNGSSWVLHSISTTHQDPRSFGAADLDRDGDTDVLSASIFDGVAFHENVSGNGAAWAGHPITNPASGFRSVAAADLDRDGRPDALAASDASDLVAWYPNRGGQFGLTGADLAPPGAMNGDLVPMLGIVVTHGGRPGDGDLEVARLGLLFEEAAGDPLTTAEANALIESLRIYRDVNDNGLFEPGIDVLVTSIPTLALAAGVQVVSFTDGDPNVQVAQGSPRRYFVVTEITADANTQDPNRFRVTHLGLGPSASQAEDRTYDLLLQPSCPTDVASSVLAPTPVELMDFRIE